ncbi:radical SAM family heme chaperone HemW [Bacillota bacterium LX-D]|nr:radical SAM family heme chaperone HemW [Bacillota bacterium LX-D]
MGVGLYLHFPFCLQKCNYCDFLSFPADKYTISTYLKALAREMELYQEQGAPWKIDTVYLGGGTPTALESEQLVQVLTRCRDFFSWDHVTEATVEANPGTVDLNKLQQLRCHGINRISFGVQSFDDELLQKMGRIHTSAQAKEGLRLAKKAGFNNLSLDLMFGLPGQTLGQWELTIKEALRIGVQHISAYGLKIEEGTLWGDLEEQGQISLPEEDVTLEMRQLANELLEAAGYNHYEISNYALPGFESQHNLGYWQYKSFLGLGLGASSQIENRRFMNEKNLPAYIQELNQNRFPIAEEEKLSEKEMMGEQVFLGLRLAQGLDSKAFQRRFKKEIEDVFKEELQELLKFKLVEFNGKYLHLTPKAVPIANQVFMYFV